MVNLDDDVLEDVKEELIYGQRLAVDEGSRSPPDVERRRLGITAVGVRLLILRPREVTQPRRERDKERSI